MTLVIRPAVETMDRVNFDPRREHVEYSIHFGFYTCRHCEAMVRFRHRDFARPAIAQFEPGDQGRFDELPIPGDVAFDASHAVRNIDFYCPGCGSPVRLIVICREFAMGAEQYTVKYVIEDDAKPAR